MSALRFNGDQGCTFRVCETVHLKLKFILVSLKSRLFPSSLSARNLYIHPMAPKPEQSPLSILGRLRFLPIFAFVCTSSNICPCDMDPKVELTIACQWAVLYLLQSEASSLARNTALRPTSNGFCIPPFGPSSRCRLASKNSETRSEKDEILQTLNEAKDS